jgi:16S rRNA (uracil1498-N3)-methyltransferase
VVKRLGVGETALLADGRGLIVTARAIEVGRDTVLFEEIDRRIDPIPDPRFVVVQALPKGDRADLAVEVLTELGADVIVPWAATRSVAQWRGADKSAKGSLRWARTATEASKQSRRPRIPGVLALHSTEQVARLLRTAALGLVLHERAPAGLPAEFEAEAHRVTSGDVVLVVGPEGGLAPDELALFMSAGGHPVRLGPEVLRTSTAGAAALAVLSVSVGRWR